MAKKKTPVAGGSNKPIKNDSEEKDDEVKPARIRPPRGPDDDDDDTSYEYTYSSGRAIVHYHQHTTVPSDGALYYLRLTGFTSDETLGSLKRTFFNVRAKSFFITEGYVQFNFDTPLEHQLALKMFYTSNLETTHPLFVEPSVAV